MTLRLRTLTLASLLTAFASGCLAQQIVPADLGIAVIDRPFRVVMRVELTPGNFYNGDVIWKLTGALPAGFAFATTEGSIGGTATVSGAFPISVEAVYPGTTLRRDFTLTVNPALSIGSPAALPLGVVGEFYNVVFIAAGGKPPYVFDLVPPPLGLTFTSSGGLSGTPTNAVKVQTRLRLTDGENVTVTRDYTYEVVAERPSPVVSDARRITIDPARSGVAPSARFTATALKDRTFGVTIASNRGGDPSAWIRANLTAGKTPAEVTISVNAAAMPSASETGVITAGELEIPFEVTASTATAGILPGVFGAEWIEGGASAALGLSVDNPSPAAVTVRTAAAAPWISVTPAEVTVPAYGTFPLTAVVDGSKVKPGGQLGGLALTSGGTTVDVPVRVFGGRGQTQIALTSPGLTFAVRPGQGSAEAQSVDVLAYGGASVNWSAELLAGQETFRLRAAGGFSTRTQATPVVVEVRPDAAPAVGTYHGLVRVTAPGSSAQYLTLVLVSSADLLPELQLVAGSQSNTYTARVLASSAAGTTFRLSANALDGGAWLTAGAASGSASTSTPGSVAVVATPSGLASGIYTGWVSVTQDNLRVRSLPVRMVIPPASCTNASKLVVTPSAPASGFAARVGLPVRIEARLIDDCLRTVSDAAVTVYFSNGDGPVRLRATSSSAGTYAGSWVPSTVAPSVGMTVRAVRGPLTDSMQLWGSVSASAGTPSLAVAVNAFTRTIGAPHAAGTILELYGSNLASATAAATAVPLPTTLAGSKVLAGGIDAPLFFAGPTQINAQWPVELDAAHWHSLVVQSGSAYSLPLTVFPAPATPGVAAFGNGGIIAQHTDFTLVTAASPARLGETVILYLVGMGSTTPPVGTGAISPQAIVNNVPSVTIDGIAADIVYAGLTPGAIGLYQINCRIPQGARAGEAAVVVTQDGVASNTSRIAVRRD